MDHQIIWSPRSLEDLRDIVEYISKDNPAAAESFGMKLIQTAESLNQLPERGRIIPKFGDPTIRDIGCGPYRIAYRIVRATGNSPRVEIARLWHGARNPETFGF